MTVPLNHPVDILRLNTCGSVDDGKSTLIGRLLYDSRSLMEDQLEALERSADLTGGGQINLANLTDGLRAEREQGITIDVAYRYFATPRRKFIIADTPGHVQYTRNMVTGASTANLSIVLVDARQGASEQSRRHTCIASLLGIPHLVIAVNKMDLVNWSEARFIEIRDQFEEFLPRLDVKDVQFIPLSALNGDNVVQPSPHTPWYPGANAPGPLGSRAHRQRLEPQRLPPARAMGQPPAQPERPGVARFPRLQRPDRRGHRARGAEGHGAAQRHGQQGEANLALTTARSRRRSARNPSRWCSKTTWTSAGVT